MCIEKIRKYGFKSSTDNVVNDNIIRLDKYGNPPDGYEVKYVVLSMETHRVLLKRVIIKKSDCDNDSKIINRRYKALR